MRWVVFVVCGCCLHANTLDLPVKYDPFMKAKKIIAQKPKVLRRTCSPSIRLDLIAIFNNKAYINGKFYTIGQNVYGYRLIDIKDRFVVLRKGKQIKILPLVKKKILKTSEQR